MHCSLMRRVCGGTSEREGTAAGVLGGAPATVGHRAGPRAAAAARAGRHARCRLVCRSAGGRRLPAHHPAAHDTTFRHRIGMLLTSSMPLASDSFFRIKWQSCAWQLPDCCVLAPTKWHLQGNLFVML